MTLGGWTVGWASLYRGPLETTRCGGVFLEQGYMCLAFACASDTPVIPACFERVGWPDRDLGPEWRHEPAPLWLAIHNI